ncbi:hypothetical protein ACJ72_02719 [Emergomyces africanus]|uniref:Uncharacterized protein n=1 Tax=Emergomyces africanus TaxID=1955775 RepID=A0A1B7P1N0_9EURO|nr:hypothetical protein ACJ72_02719 [Emergomyces africanus]
MKAHNYDRVHKDQAGKNASSQERQILQSPDHNAADAVNSDFFEEMGCIPDALEAGNMEKRLIEELTNLNSSWEPNFHQQNAMQSHPSYATSEAATHPGYLFNTIADNRSPLAMSDIHPWRLNNRSSSPVRSAAPSLQSNPRQIQVISSDKIHAPPLSEQQPCGQPGSKSISAATSRLPDLNRGLGQDNDIKTHENPLHTTVDGSNHLDDSFQPISQEIGTMTDTSGMINNRCKSKRRAAYGAGEDRLENILSAIEEEGYESLDAVAAEYYTGQFPKDSLLASEQFHSRTRRLGRLLHQVHQSCKTWSRKETAGYRDMVIRAAEELFQEEVRSRRRELGAHVEMHQPDHPSPSPSFINSPWMASREDPEILGSGAAASQRDTRTSAYTAVRNLLHEKDLAPVLMQDVCRLQNTVRGFS